MKRKLVYTLASAVAFSTVPATNVAMVFANENTLKTQQVVQIKTAQEFVNKYCSLQKMDSNGNLINEYELITSITEKNYQVILSGKTVYDTLSDSLKQEVNTLVQNQLASVMTAEYTTYDGMVAAAQKVDTQVKQAQEIKTDSNTTTTPENKETTDAQPGQTVIEEKKEINTEEPGKNQSSNEDKKENSKEEPKDEKKENTSQEDSKEATKENTKEIDKAAKEAVATKEKAEPIDENYGISTADLVYPEIVAYTTGIEKQASTETQTIQVEVPVTLETLSQPMTTQTQEVITTSSTTSVAKKSSSSSEDATAQKFIDTYLTSSAGNVYTQANSLNYTNIINGLPEWTKFSSSQKEAVNAILKSKVGKTYQTLLKEAQQIQYNGVTSSYTGKSTKVNTAVGNESGFYGALMGASVAIGIFITRKRKEQD